jgi:hypothetical protein
MKLIILLLSGFLPLSLSANFSYSEAADVFEIVDQLSQWHPSMHKEYRRAWETKFGVFKEDIHIQKYAYIRNEYYEKAKSKSSPLPNIFGERDASFDFISKAFYSSKSVGEAIKKLQKKLKPNEIKILKNVYTKYRPQISQLVKQSTAFKPHIIDWNKKWKKNRGLIILKKASAFLGLKLTKKNNIRIMPIWWPSGLAPLIETRGNILLLRTHPHEEEMTWKSHEIILKSIDSMMRHFSPNQKSNLSAIFEKSCSGRGPEFTDALLLMWSNIYPQKIRLKKEFSLYKDWAPKVFLNIYIKLLFPLLEQVVKKKGVIGGDFIQKAALLCRDLHYLATKR